METPPKQLVLVHGPSFRGSVGGSPGWSYTPINSWDIHGGYPQKFALEFWRVEC